MAKNIAKSVRLSDEVFEYIQAYKGDGFNEKFENIILYAMNSEAERNERIKRLDELIASKEKQFNLIRDKLDKLDRFVYAALRINSSVLELQQQLQDIIDS